MKVLEKNCLLFVITVLPGLVSGAYAAKEVEVQKSPSKVSRIVGGTCTNIKRYPYFVAIAVKQQHRYDNRFKNDEQICGGSIIGRFWIITSGTCIELIETHEIDLSDVYVISGMSNWNQNPKEYHTHKIERWELPTENRTTFSQIALIRVDTSFRDADRIKVKLAGLHYHMKIGSRCTAVGLGSTGLLAILTENTNCVRKVDLKIFKEEKCVGDLKEPEEIAVLKDVEDKLVCAGSSKEGQNVCFKDYGGPLVQNRVLIGIIFVWTPCELSEVSMYVKVGYYQQWIESFEKSIKESTGAVFVNN